MSPSHLINEALHARLSYDPLKSFVAVTQVADVPNILSIHPSIAARSVRELIALAKAKPGSLAYGSAGTGSSQHLSGELFKKMAGVELLHVPFKGSVAAVTEIIANRLSMMLATISVFAQQEQAGKLRILAAATEKRLLLRPDLPTIAESGVPGFSVNVWFGLVAPASTPTGILDRIHADVVKIVKSTEFYDNFLKPQAVEPGGNSRLEFAAQLRSELTMWGKLVADSGAKAE